MTAFIDAHHARFGVVPICRVLTEHGCPIAPNTYYAARSRGPSALPEGMASLLGGRLITGNPSGWSTAQVRSKHWATATSSTCSSNPPVHGTARTW